MNITPDNITKLSDTEIFVFGSNYAGRHGRGAALLAVRKFGAINGKGTGLMGRSYGIATKDRNIKTLPLASIEAQVDKFMIFASKNKDKKFLVTEIGCGLAGYKIKDIAPMFLKHSIPDNVSLPKRFWDFVA